MITDQIDLKEKRYDAILQHLKKITRRLDELELLRKTIFTSKEACVYLGISQSKLYKLTSKREVVFSKPDQGKLYFRREDLDEYMLRQIVQSESKLEQKAELLANNISLPKK